ncbi:MAG: CHRD domain-containing protein [Bacteroidota bacterium]
MFNRDFILFRLLLLGLFIWGGLTTAQTPGAIIRIVEVDTDNERVVLENFGTVMENLSSFQFCLGPGQYNSLSNYSSIMGSLNLMPGSLVTINLSSGSQGVTALPTNGGLGLFFNSSFGSSSPNDIADYVQWGAANQARVGQAVTAGRWDNAMNFVSGVSPYDFVGGANDVGSTWWTGSTTPAIVRMVHVDTDNETVTLKNFGGTTEDVTTYNFCLGPGQYNVLSDYTVWTGNLNLEPDSSVTFDLTSGSLGVTALPSTGGLGLFINAVFGSTSPNDLGDYVQWGAANQARVGQAVTAGRWDNAMNFVGNLSPYTYNGGANDVGATWWSGTTPPAIVRMVEVNTDNETVTLKNFGGTTEDVTTYNFCLGPGQYNVLSDYTVWIGNRNLEPDSSVTFDLTSGSLGVTALPSTGGLGLFINAVFGSTSPNDLGDYVQWGAANQARVGQAVTAGRWDDAMNFVGNLSPYTYNGGANDVGAVWWSGVTPPPAIVRMVEVDTDNETVTLKNFGGTTEDVTTYNFCLGPGQYNVLSDYTVWTGNRNLEPDSSVTFDLTSGSLGVTALPSTGGLGLFINAVFGSTSPNDLGDYVQWGAANQARVGQAVTAGRWDDAMNFVAGVSPYIYFGGANDVGAAFWSGQQVEMFAAKLTGAQQVEPKETTAGGTIYVDLNGTTLTVYGSVNGLSSSIDTSIAGGVHIHNGLAGQNGPIELLLSLSLSADGTSATFAAGDNTFTLTQAQVDALQARGLYVNVHTLNYAAGEVRGQILKRDDQNSIATSFFSSNLYGSNEVHSVLSEAYGALVFDLIGDTLTASGSFTNLSDSVAIDLAGGAHIHLGYAGQNGGIELILTPNLNVDGNGGTFEAVDNAFVLTQAQKDYLVGRQLYINIHSQRFRSGELRGQIVGMPSMVFRSFLAGAQEVPAIVTAAQGQLIHELFGPDSLLSTGYFRDFGSDFNVNAAGGAHLHQAIAGQNGGIAILLDASLNADNRSGQFEAAQNGNSLDSATLQYLLKRELYANLHSIDNASGELRGQAVPEGNYFLYALLSATQEVTPAISQASGTVVIEKRFGKLLVSGSFNDLANGFNESIAGGSHIHVGMAGQNGGIQFVLVPDLNSDESAGVFYAENNSFDISVGEADTLKERRLYINIHSDSIASGELRGQLMAEAQNYFFSPLSGTSELIPVKTAAYGNTISEWKDGSLTTSGSFNNLESALNTALAGGAHIHAGLAGQNGPIVWILNAEVSADQLSGEFLADSNAFTLSAGQTDTLVERRLYVNIHSLDNASGELRGQILPYAESYFTTTISSKNEVQPVLTTAEGALKIELTNGQMVVSGRFAQLEGDFDANINGGSHLHAAEADANGPIEVIVVPQLDGDLKGGNFEAIDNVFALDSAQEVKLSNEGLYLNLHSTLVPSGEARGQILPESNEFPEPEPMITAPASNASISIEGDSTENFQATFTEAADPDGNPVVYFWELSATRDFADPLVFSNVGKPAEFNADYGTVANILADAGVQVGQSITLYHRAAASDGAVQAVGEADSVYLTRGILGTTSIEENDLDQQVLLFPSPVENVLRIRTDELAGEGQLRVLDVFGRVVMRSSIQLGSDSLLDVSSLAEGLYFVEISQQDWVETNRILKE